MAAHNLLRLLEMPPADDGLYVCAGRSVELAEKMGWLMNHLTNALNERNGPPISYWRVGTRLGDGPFIWPAMRDGGMRLSVGRRSAIYLLSPPERR